jgi:hypothetical protein
MTLTFLNSAMMAAAVLAAMPLAIHMLARSNPPTYAFSSNMLLEKIVRTATRVKKPHDILLLLLRTLLISAIILVFLKPVLYSNAKMAAPWEKRDVVILIDASASMAGMENGQTRFAAAQAVASDILMGMGKMDKANIIFIQAKPNPVFPSLASNVRFLANRLGEASVSNEPGNQEAAFERAIEMLTLEDGAAKEICVVSDFQKKQWEKRKWTPPRPDVAVTFVKVGGTKGDNIALLKASATPPRPLAGEKIRFECDLANYSSAPKRTVVYFKLGPVRNSRTILLPPWTRATAAFHADAAELTLDATPYEFSIDQDAFPEDNKRWGLVRVSENIRVGMAGALEYPARIWRRALKTLPWIETATVTLDALSPDDRLDFLFISGWDGSNPGKLKKLMAAGTVVICAPKPGLATKEMAALAPGEFSGKTNAKLLMESAQGKPFATRLAAPKDKIFEIFANGRYGDPADAALLQKLAPMDTFFKGEKKLVAFSDGGTALARCGFKNGGTLYLWNICLDPEKSNFAKRVQFVPFIAELILKERKKSPAELAHILERSPGERLFAPIDSAEAEHGTSLLTPTGKTLKTKLSIGRNAAPSSIAIVSEATSETGLYKWQFDGKTIATAVVNFPSSESDLRTMTIKELGRCGDADTVASQENAVAARKGSSIWPFLLALAFLLAICESAVSFHAEKTTIKDNKV